ncbi:MAG: uncharacterized protein K0R73_329 [Candidatus Midichloriaceae bacterium]|nr:uncharacterized protein [Candidatus Midichloriaceae bacterium]
MKDPQLPLVIWGSIGYPSSNKILEVIKKYNDPGHELIGAFIDDVLVGVIGLLKADKNITIGHISVLPQFQRRGMGSLLINHVKSHRGSHTLIAETDEESVGFYAKIGFSCQPFKGQYGGLRYRCEFR